eukprot:scaffold12235_cov78-Skeletonema_dohrnii-CCMP3373.AAC.4
MRGVLPFICSVLDAFYLINNLGKISVKIFRIRYHRCWMGGFLKACSGDYIMMKRLHGLGSVVDQEVKEAVLSLVVQNAGGMSRGDDVGMLLVERSRDIGGDPVILLTG